MVQNRTFIHIACLGCALVQLPTTLLSLFRYLEHYFNRNTIQEKSVGTNNRLVISRKCDLKKDSKKSVSSSKDFQLCTLYDENNSLGDNNYNSMNYITVRDLRIEKERIDKLESEHSLFLQKIEMLQRQIYK